MTAKRVACLTRPFVLLGILVVLVVACSSPPAAALRTTTPTLPAAPATYWPTEGWRTSSPEDQGLDAQKLGQALIAVQEQRLNLHSLLVIRHGYLVSETYFGSYRQDTRHELYSCTKSFVSTLIGIAIDQGYIDGTGHRVPDFFPGRSFANFDAQKLAMTVDDVLTMRAGLDWEEGDPSYARLYTSPDWVQFMLDKPMVAAPGSLFNYCSGCSHLLSAIIQETTGMNPRDFAEQVLFEPLGISDAVWEVDSGGTPIGGWGLKLTPRDMAKLGYLVLHDGQWDGQQIVSAQWVESATRIHVEVDGDLDYGYQWWIYPSLEGYAALGLYGQMILVIPESDLVVVTTAQMDSHDEIFRLVRDYVLPAVQVAQ
jgi:CubicO group peptidase (beta-lactamase class C family)